VGKPKEEKKSKACVRRGELTRLKDRESVKMRGSVMACGNSLAVGKERKQSTLSIEVRSVKIDIWEIVPIRTSTSNGGNWETALYSTTGNRKRRGEDWRSFCQEMATVRGMADQQVWRKGLLNLKKR